MGNKQTTTSYNAFPMPVYVAAASRNSDCKHQRSVALRVRNADSHDADLRPPQVYSHATQRETADPVQRRWLMLVQCVYRHLQKRYLSPFVTLTSTFIDHVKL